MTMTNAVTELLPDVVAIDRKRTAPTGVTPSDWSG